MQGSISRLAEAAMLATLLVPASALLDCANIRADDQKFDFSKLKGPHSVTTFEKSGDATWNTTYTVDLCGPLKKKGGKKDEECPNGAWG